MAVLTYNKAITYIANAVIDLGNSTANQFYMMLLEGMPFNATNTVVGNVVGTWSTNVANANLHNITLDDTSSAGNTIWKADDVTFTATGACNTNCFVIYANTSGTQNDRKLVCYNSFGTWVNMVTNDTLTVYTNAGIIRIDDTGT
jgi:hypothetical protein